MSTDLAQHYRDYLAVLDARRLDDLDRFVAEELLHDDRPLTRAGYRALLEEDVRLIPDLRYDLQELVVQGTDVAARLWFDCTPVADFRGLPTAGRRVQFAEHAFYRFTDGRITQVRSVVDLAAVRRQVSRS